MTCNKYQRDTTLLCACLLLPLVLAVILARSKYRPPRKDARPRQNARPQPDRRTRKVHGLQDSGDRSCCGAPVT